MITRINNIAIENVETFRYLGYQIHFQLFGTADEELNLQIDSATSRFYALSKKMFNQSISLSVRVKIMNALVRTRLTHGCATWILTKRQQDRMDSQYNIILRKMTRDGFKRKPDSNAFKYTNEKLYEIGRTRPLSEYIAKQQNAYLAHVIREADVTMTKHMLFETTIPRIPGRNNSYLKRIAEKSKSTIKEFVDTAMRKEH